jgi:hypothetical protein
MSSSHSTPINGLLAGILVLVLFASLAIAMAAGGSGGDTTQAATPQTADEPLRGGDGGRLDARGDGDGRFDRRFDGFGGRGR